MIDITKLSEEQKEAFRKQLQEEERAKKNKVKEEREQYKLLVEEAVLRNFEKLQKASEALKTTKGEVFEEFDSLIKMKQELYGVLGGQFSNTFTTKDGVSIVVGSRSTDSFDDTVHEGIEKIKRYLKNAVSKETSIVEEILNALLKKDKNGNMRANRVLELRNLVEKVDNEEFTDGVKIIEDAYKPQKTSTFIDCYYKEKDTGKRIYVPLTMTGV